MKYIKQLLIILTISGVGELLNYLIPLPIPASIYGIVILFTLLMLKIVKVEDIKECATFLIEIMALMFIAPAVGLLDIWPSIKSNALIYIFIALLSTIIVMTTAGVVTEAILKKGGKK